MDLVDDLRIITLRLADYDAVRAAEIERQCTITEVAEAAVLKQHDNACEIEVDESHGIKK